MSEFSATDVALEGFRVTKERWVPVLVWSVVEFIYTMVTFAILAVMAGPALTDFMTASATVTDPQVLLAKLAGLAPAMLILLPVGLAFQSVLQCAFFRAVLKPGDKRFYYLSLGREELRVIGAMLLLYVLFILYYMAAAIIVITPVVAMKAAGQGAVGGAIAMLGVVAAICGLIYGAVRLSLFVPQVFAEGGTDLRAAWRLTEGRFWVLFGVYVMAAILALLVYLLGNVFMMLMHAVTASQWVSAADLAKEKGLSLTTLSQPLSIAATAMLAFFGMLMRVIMSAPSPAAYAALKNRG